MEDAIVAEFLKNKFLASFKSAEVNELDSLPFFNLTSCFSDIRDVVRSIGMERANPVYIVDMLDELNDALTESRVFATQYKDDELKNKFLLCNPVTGYYFNWRMKKRLALHLEWWKRVLELELERQMASIAEEEGEGQKEKNPERKIINSVSSEVLGFDEEAENVEALLFRPGFTAVGIIGVAGSGKTTLMEKVLRSERVREEFPVIVRLVISNSVQGSQLYWPTARADFMKYFLDVLDDYGIAADDGEERVSSSLGESLKMLKRRLSGKRYLIAMDDVWDSYGGFLSQLNSESGVLGNCLSNGLPKDSDGAVIVTSRITEVARDMVGSNNLVRVKPLAGETCWRIFMASIPTDILISTHQTLRKIKNDIEDRCHGLPLAAKTLAQVIPSHIHEIQSKRYVVKGMYIPDEFLTPDFQVQTNVKVPEYPALVFIDMKNKQLGRKSFAEFSKCLNEKQAYAVVQGSSDPKENPERILKEFYGTLKKLQLQGYGFASIIQERMRIIIVGGDAMTNWILRVICDLELPKSPSIAVIPLGMENNMSLVYGLSCCGITDETETARSNITSICRAVAAAEPIRTDSWIILIRMKALESSAAQAMPDSWHLLRPVTEEKIRTIIEDQSPFDLGNNPDNPSFCGRFWNYIILGVDAPSRGWHWASRIRPRTLTSVAKVMIRKNNHDGEWELLNIPSSINSILCHNLRCFHGGLQPWREKNRRNNQNASFVDDALMEIIGCKQVLPPQNGVEWVPLVQTRGIRFEFTEEGAGAAEAVHMRIDGAPWKKIPIVNGLAEIEISYGHTGSILAGRFHQAKSIHGDSPRQPFDGYNAVQGHYKTTSLW